MNSTLVSFWGRTSGGVYVPLYLHACQVKVTVGDSGLCCCTCYVFRALINSLVCWFCPCIFVCTFGSFSFRFVSQPSCDMCHKQWVRCFGFGWKSFVLPWYQRFSMCSFWRCDPQDCMGIASSSSVPPPSSHWFIFFVVSLSFAPFYPPSLFQLDFESCIYLFMNDF